MFTFLALTDFSSNAHSALLSAVKLARLYNAEVIFLHVMAQPMIPATSPEEVYESVFESEKQNTLKQLKDDVQAIFEEAEIRTSEVTKQYLVMPEPLADTVQSVAQKYKIDLIVTGISGSSGLKRLLIGSNAIEIMSISLVPVLIIPKTYNFNGLKIITVIAHTPSKHREGIKILFKLARSYNAKINICYIQGSEPNDILDLSNIHFTTEELNYLKENDYELYTIKSSDKKNQLKSIVTDTKTDLLVSLSKASKIWDDRFLGGSTLSVAEQLKLPLLMIPKSEPD